MGWSWIKPLAVLWVGGGVYIGMCYATWNRTIDVHAEYGPVESAQLFAWVIAVVTAGVATATARNWRDRLSAAWLLALALLAGAREFDLHEAVQRQESWLPPVHFRIDWLLNSGEPLWPKVFWGAVFAVAGAAVLIPPLRTKAPTGRFLRVGDGPTWLFILACAGLAGGYLSDDILGRGRLGIHYEVTQGIEEFFELCGALAFALATWFELTYPLSRRAAAVGPAPDSARATHS